MGNLNLTALGGAPTRNPFQSSLFSFQRNLAVVPLCINGIQQNPATATSFPGILRRKQPGNRYRCRNNGHVLVESSQIP